ncbi:ABC transporter substrate-binding protein [Arsenicicoccus dermatophilus]|uniref:ABC transporter substrate-binding protein n=1 Tax=Arsenicicoccus dermatophilus TaxID=1076331 RepID=UPI001F4CAEEC|nr:ABC transporter substrate-binding protein [Arsenicicoccus dermatophilus]MCH8611842.1 ABC transporter substrate-binding protein [Arsenicicoccus dermatophilus]
MTHRRRRARTTLPIALAVLLAGGCMPGGSSAQDSSSGSAPRLRVALNFPPVAGLSPYSDDAVLLTRAGITESLVRFDKDGTPQPALAQSFSMVGDRTARFVLRKGVTFHDGTPMDAQAVAGALTRAISAKPAPETVSGRPLTVKAVGADTVEVTSARPDPVLVQRLGNPDLAILAPKAYAKDPNRPDPTGAGTGPFRLVGVTGASEAKADANPTYWGGRPRLAGLDIRFIGKADARTAALRDGQVDVIQNVPIAQIANVGADKVVSRPVPRTTGIHLNAAKGAFADPALRVAARAAIDPAAVATGVFEGQADPARGFFRGDTAWAQSRPAPTFPAAGAVNGQRITLATYTDRPELPEAATVVADQLRKAGFVVDAPVVKSYTLLERDIAAGTYDAVIGSRMYLSQAADPLSGLQSDFTCAGTFNQSHLCDRDLDALVAQGSSLPDVAARRTAALAAEARMLGTAAYVPLVHERVRIGRVAGVTGLSDDPLEWRMVTEQTALAR